VSTVREIGVPRQETSAVKRWGRLPSCQVNRATGWKPIPRESDTYFSNGAKYAITSVRSTAFRRSCGPCGFRLKPVLRTR